MICNLTNNWHLSGMRLGVVSILWISLDTYYPRVTWSLSSKVWSWVWSCWPILARTIILWLTYQSIVLPLLLSWDSLYRWWLDTSLGWLLSLYELTWIWGTCRNPLQTHTSWGWAASFGILELWKPHTCLVNIRLGPRT